MLPLLPHVRTASQCTQAKEKPLCGSDGLISAPYSGLWQVDSGQVELQNGTLIELNAAPRGRGSSIYLSEATDAGPGSDGIGVVVYTLPAPPGRWLFVRNGISSQLDTGAEDSDFPYPCRLVDTLITHLLLALAFAPSPHRLPHI